MRNGIIAMATSVTAIAVTLAAIAAPASAVTPAAASAAGSAVAHRLSPLGNELAEVKGMKTLRASFSADVSGAVTTAGPPVIDCFIVVHNPHVSTHVTTAGMAKVTSQVVCTFPVAAIAMAGGLWRDSGSNMVGRASTFNIASATLKLDVVATCVTGAYIGQSIAGITAPPGYTPPYGEIFATSNGVFLACGP